MTEIDFVPQWYRSSQCRRRDLAVRVTCLCVLAAAMVAWSIHNLAATAAARADLAVLQDSFRSQEILLDQYAGLQRRLDELEGQQALLQALRGGARVKQLLAELSHLMPDAMALTDVALNLRDRVEAGGQRGSQPSRGDSTPGTVTVKGLAASNVEVGSLLAALDRSPCFREVEMSYSRPVLRDGRQAREFRVVFRVPRFE